MDWWRKKKNKKKLILERSNQILENQILERGAMLLEDLIECCDGKSNPIKFFSADEIIKATDNFSESNRVSELVDSGYNWYSGKTENHHKILIMEDNYLESPTNRHRVWRDIAVSSMVSGHKNFLKLVGCCLELEYPNSVGNYLALKFIGWLKNPVLVYNGVKKHYNLDISEQPWKRRMKIAEDIATALAYLHTAFPRPFVYTSLHIGKIFLDEDGVAKLADFSYCVSIPEGQTFVKVADTGEEVYSFMDLNFRKNGVVSEKTDIFAIGIIMQMLLMGQERFYEILQPRWVRMIREAKEKGDVEGDDDDDSYDSATMSGTNDQRREDSYWLFNYLEERRMDEIADPKMLTKMGAISEQELCQMKAFLMLSLRCIGRKGEVPTMMEVAKELKKIQRSLNHDSSSPSGETQFDSPQVISSSVLLSNQT